MPSVFFLSLMSAAPWGGSEELWFRTALLAQQKGWKVGCAVYHWDQKEARLKSLVDAGAHIIFLPNKGRSKKNLLDRIRNKASKAKVKNMVAQLPFAQYDLVVVNMGAFEITMPAWQQLPALLSNFIVLYHNYREGEFFQGDQKKAIENLSAKAKRNLLASRRIAEVLEEYSAISLPRKGILFNPITFPAPQTVTPYPSYDSGIHFVMLAALEVNRKAQDELINALATPEWRARKWTLHLYGEGKDRSFLEKLVAEKGLKEKVWLHGHTKDAFKALEQSHLLLQVTHQDAMPLSVVEAMACARPVIVSRIGDMPYWVEEGENGWVVENASANTIANALEHAWEARNHWEEMGRKSFAIFQSRFPESAEDDLLRIMEEAIDQGHREHKGAQRT